MALQNIGASNRDDAFYRYKMPRMITKIEGRGNGIKTNVVNMVEIAKALARPPSYTTKYFGCELGAQSKFDEKTGTSLVNGAHETGKLAGLLENFIKKYVQCYGCGNPETEIITTKSQMIVLKCAACGFLSDVDMRDKLTAFIIKNPPEPKKGSKDKKAMRRAEKERLKEGEAADEEQKKLKKEAARKKPSKEPVPKVKKADEDHSPTGRNGTVEEEDDDDGGVEWQTDTSVEAAHKRIKEQLSSVTAGMVMLSTEEGGKQEKPGDEIAGFLRNGASPSQLKAFLSTLYSSSSGASHQEIMNALIFSMFEKAEGGFAEEVRKKKMYVAAAVQSEGSQTLLLHALASFCMKSKRLSAGNEVALALKVLYDGDVVEEESVLEWYRRGSSGPDRDDLIWKKVKPFAEWLQSAESESE